MQNKETLIQGNLTMLWEKVPIAAKPVDMSDLEKTADRGKDKLGDFGGGLDQYFNLIPGRSEIIPKFQQLSLRIYSNRKWLLHRKAKIDLNTPYSVCIVARIRWLLISIVPKRCGGLRPCLGPVTSLRI